MLLNDHKTIITTSLINIFGSTQWWDHYTDIDFPYFFCNQNLCILLIIVGLKYSTQIWAWFNYESHIEMFLLPCSGNWWAFYSRIHTLLSSLYTHCIMTATNKDSLTHRDVDFYHTMSISTTALWQRKNSASMMHGTFQNIWPKVSQYRGSHMW